MTDDAQIAAVQELLAIHPDCGESCLCRNILQEPLPYDLQIVVPAYNAACHIVECMDSILSQQTHFRYVVTVVNDGSTDNTSQLLQSYAAHPNVVLIEQNNRGFSGARNKALEHILARYIMYVDADDRLCPGAIETLVQIAEREHAEIVEGSYQCFNGAKTISSYVHKDESTGDWSVLYGYPWGKVFRSELFANIHFPQGYWFEDTICTYMLYPQCSHVVTTQYMVYDYRINDHGITSLSQGNVRTLDALWVTKRILADAHSYGIPWSQALYESFLRDLCTNYMRFSSLKHPTAHRDAFVVSCALRKQYFSGYRTDVLELKPLEDALAEGDYGTYLLYGRCYLCV